LTRIANKPKPYVGRIAPIRRTVLLTDAAPPYRRALHDARLYYPPRTYVGDSAELRDAERKAAAAYYERSRQLKDAWRSPDNPPTPEPEEGESERDAYIRRVSNGWKTSGPYAWTEPPPRMMGQRLSLGPQRSHFADRVLLGRMQDKFAVIATPETEGNFPAEISAARLLVGFHVANALADTVALRFCKGGGDRGTAWTTPTAIVHLCACNQKCGAASFATRDS
jgi:hypothetical protein